MPNIGHGGPSLAVVPPIPIHYRNFFCEKIDVISAVLEKPPSSCPSGEVSSTSSSSWCAEEELEQDDVYPPWGASVAAALRGAAAPSSSLAAMSSSTSAAGPVASSSTSTSATSTPAGNQQHLPPIMCGTGAEIMSEEESTAVYINNNLPINAFPTIEDIRRKGKLCDVTLKVWSRFKLYIWFWSVSSIYSLSLSLSQNTMTETLSDDLIYMCIQYTLYD